MHKATSEDTRWATKALMRLFAAFTGLIAMCLFSAAISYENANFENTMGNGDWPDGLALAPIILSLLFNPVAFVMHLMFRKSRPIHPAVRMTLDLLVWILAAPAIVVCIGSGVFWLWTPATPSADGTVDCFNIMNAFSQECSPIAYTIGKLQIAGIVFLCILFVCHLTLFIYATIDMRNRMLANRSQSSEEFDMSHAKDVEAQSQSS
ncbi:MAG: hypothetical protein GOMPHAMPRED_000100 [Gomphillus americanus]|uniref:Uncharacterized protein n=1 Tax=Gomphillus americanus TaxID=1940652 RepID=A0A8H3I4M7_9LECA|nr:MAG: hypothetical protein GOMPHAMPRED_000100 [Gomphillus americanus]